MRFYYIFSIKDDLISEASKNPQNIYNILENIYMSDENNAKLFRDIVNKIDIYNINVLLREINSENMNYMCFKSIHNINDVLKQESTKLIIRDYYMLLKSNCDYPSFLKDIKRLPNLFICDFINEDYFFLNKIASCSLRK